jgi:HEAT repeat protein
VRKVFVSCLIALSAGCGRGQSTADLLEQLRAEEPARRLHAIRALGERGGEAAVVAPALALALRDEDAFVRRDAALALGRIGPEARPTAPALVAALKDRKAKVRLAAARALGRIDPDALARAGRQD